MSLVLPFYSNDFPRSRNLVPKEVCGSLICPSTLHVCCRAKKRGKFPRWTWKWLTCRLYGIRMFLHKLLFNEIADSLMLLLILGSSCALVSAPVYAVPLHTMVCRSNTFACVYVWN